MDTSKNNIRRHFKRSWKTRLHTARPFFVPERARWHEPWFDKETEQEVPALKHLKHDIGNMLNKAIAAIEDANDSLAGVLKNNIDFNEVTGRNPFQQ
nr:type I restriction-modification system subunit M N-terminal domain-containing protein [Oceanidesulfovibrio indonesiensis]